jgi:hypothetical protein
LKTSSDLRMESKVIYSLGIIFQTVVSWKGDETHQVRLECVRSLVRVLHGNGPQVKGS